MDVDVDARHPFFSYVFVGSSCFEELRNLFLTES